MGSGTLRSSVCRTPQEPGLHASSVDLKWLGTLDSLRFQRAADAASWEMTGTAASTGRERKCMDGRGDWIRTCWSAASQRAA